MKIIAIYDNGGKTCDRYTVYFDSRLSDGTYECLAMSEDPLSPQGIACHSNGKLGEHNGKQIHLEDLPIDCIKATLLNMVDAKTLYIIERD